MNEDVNNLNSQINDAEAKYAAPGSNAPPEIHHSNGTFTAPAIAVPTTAAPATPAPQPSYSQAPRQAINTAITGTGSMSIISIIGMILMSSIPLAGFIAMLIFACGGGKKSCLERRNLAIALLIVNAFSVAFWAFLFNIFYGILSQFFYF